MDVKNNKRLPNKKDIGFFLQKGQVSRIVEGDLLVGPTCNVYDTEILTLLLNHLRNRDLQKPALIQLYRLHCFL